MGKGRPGKGRVKELGNVQAYLRTGDPRMWLTPHRNLSWGGASGGGGLGALCVSSCKDSSTGGESRLVTEEGGLQMLQGLSRVGLKASFSPRSLGLLFGLPWEETHVKEQEIPGRLQALNKLSVSVP